MASSLLNFEGKSNYSPKNPDPSTLTILRTQKHPCIIQVQSLPLLEGPRILRELEKKTFQERYVPQTQNRTIPNICFFVLVSVAIKRAKVSNMIIMDKPLNH